MHADEARALLGVASTADADELRRARRRLAAVVHPDVGGSVEEMTRVNEAYRILVSVVVQPDPSRVRAERDPVDRPSFVIDALPVEAFEVVELAARVLGDVVDDDPPYGLDVHLATIGFCRLEIVPDAGSSTVSVVVERGVSAEEVGALFVRTINELGRPRP